MAIPLYLAATSAEFAAGSALPDRLAWMACHFSPYGTGITNLPKALPEGSLLILNDRTPISGHDPDTVCQMLQDAANRLRCHGILLDFQHGGCEDIVKKAALLPFPVAVTEQYANIANCTVFLSAPPIRTPITEYIAPWKNREIWLEAAFGNEEIIFTQKGSTISQTTANGAYPFCDETLHCRYRTDVSTDCIHFQLHRGKEELDTLLEEAESLGVKLAVGLYQELGK